MPRAWRRRHCKVVGCDRKHYAKGYCVTHYRRWQRNGHPGPAKIGVRKYSDDDQCSEHGCTRRPSHRGMCYQHYKKKYDQGLIPKRGEK